jgi:hypothetical protein
MVAGTEVERQTGRCYSVGFEDEGRTQARNACASKSWKRLRNRFSSRISRTKCSSANIFILVWCDLFSTSDLLSYMTIDLCCFKALICSDLLCSS